eukprot:8539832-Pyramimonas_sp.AAC.1
MHSLHGWHYAIPSRVNVDLPRLQARLYELMAESFPVKEDTRQTLFRRVAAWFPGISQRSMDRPWINSYYVPLKTQPYMLVGTMRILCRGLCTTKRYKSSPA